MEICTGIEKGLEGQVTARTTAYSKASRLKRSTPAISAPASSSTITTPEWPPVAKWLGSHSS